jgi:hypothetical protein
MQRCHHPPVLVGVGGSPVRLEVGQNSEVVEVPVGITAA